MIDTMDPIIQKLERFKKCCGRSERGFLGLGEALAKEQVA
jgi:hypothetical protein